jgi:hypothetical protein
MTVIPSFLPLFFVHPVRNVAWEIMLLVEEALPITMALRKKRQN